MKGLNPVFFGVIAFAYPLMVFFGLGHYGPRGLALFLLGFTVLKFFLTDHKTRMQAIGCILISLFCISIILIDSELLLRFYPVMLSLGIAAIFFFSLWDEETFIERMVALRQGEISQPARRYMRKLTIWWVAVLIANASVAAYTALFLSLSGWTLYNGLISYIFIGLFMLVEWRYRQYYKRLHGVIT